MRRLDAGSGVAALGGLLLLVGLFLDWFGPYTAWTIFEVLDLLLAAIGLLAITTFLRRSGFEPRLPDLPLLALGVAALALVVSQLLNHPPAAIELDAEQGAWLALAGAALILAGALMSVARISLAVSVEHRDEAAPPSGDPSQPDTVAGPGPSSPAAGPASPPPAPGSSPPGSDDETTRLSGPDRPA